VNNILKPILWFVDSNSENDSGKIKGNNFNRAAYIIKHKDDAGINKLFSVL
jgi:hypothetical protein